MSGREVIGAGPEQGMCGCPAVGLCVRGQQLCGSRDNGYAGAAAGFGSRVTGSKLGPVQRIVLISVFTTLREEAAMVVGGLFSHLLVESYDNRVCLRALSRR